MIVKVLYHKLHGIRQQVHLKYTVMSIMMLEEAILWLLMVMEEMGMILMSRLVQQMFMLG